MKRESSFTISGFKDSVSDANGVYKLKGTSKYDIDRIYVKDTNPTWKIIWDTVTEKWQLLNDVNQKFIYSNTSNLNSGFTSNEDNNIGFGNQSSNFSRVFIDTSYSSNTAILPPQLIPSDIQEFKRSGAYRWYLTKAEEADLYDRKNDESLKNSIPEFLIRDNQNDEFLKFLDMIGEHFDIIFIYIESMSATRDVRNSSRKGIPNNLIWFVMNSFGARFIGRELGGDGDTIDMDKLGGLVVNDRDVIWRRILNNLPYILKTSGTENSIRSLLRCYGVLDYLFNVREYGGVNYGTDTYSDDVKFNIDVYDYRLIFSEDNQYIEIPWGDLFKNIIGSLEFRINISPKLFRNGVRKLCIW